MTKLWILFAPLCAAWLFSGSAMIYAQHEVTARLIETASNRNHAKAEPRAAVLWLEPLSLASGVSLPRTPQTSYRLLQKNKVFSPHLLVIPVGAVVTFPNADPFFHNVFSLFEGKRFDLGLYESGRSREVRFERKGISYIFCNIHPEMGAIVIALTTPFWTTPQTDGTFHITNVSDGLYEAHLWIEGEDDRKLVEWTHTLSVHSQIDPVDAGTFSTAAARTASHSDKFYRPYKTDPAAY